MKRLEKLRQDAARSSRSNGSIADLPRISVDSNPDFGNSPSPLPHLNVSHATSSPNASAEDITAVAPPTNQYRLASPGQDEVEPSPSNGEASSSEPSRRNEEAPASHSPTLDNGAEAIFQAVSVSPPQIDIAAPPPSVPPLIEFHTAGPASGPRSGPPSQMRNLVFRQRPNSIPPLDGGATEAAQIASLAQVSSNGTGMDRFVAMAERESITGTELAVPKQPQRRASRFTWIVGAFLVFLLSGLGVAMWLVPSARTNMTAGEVKK